jgi:hypothetical protein
MEVSMRSATAVALGALALGMGAVCEGAVDPRAAGSAPVTIVGPVDTNGSVKISGTATVNGTVAATQSGAWSVGQSGAWTVGQSGPWTVGLEGPAAAALGHIDAATAGLRYDDDGNLKVSIPGGSAADPSVADRSPFGFSAHSSFTGSITIAGPADGKVTAYSFHSDHDMVVVFERGGSAAFALWVPANQSVVGSFHHALQADGLQLQCQGGGTCTVLYSAAGY